MSDKFTSEADRILLSTSKLRCMYVFLWSKIKQVFILINSAKV